MAAGGSNIVSHRHRGAHTGQGVGVLREGTTPLPFMAVVVPALDSLDEISLIRRMVIAELAA